MDTFFETQPGQPHTTVHSRVWDHPGAVVDVGCRGWDWSGAFIGKKRVIGVDPDRGTTAIPGTELHQSLLGPYDGVVSFRGETTVGAPADGPQNAIWTWKRFARAAIDARGVAILKLNIEGGEWPLLASMDADDFAQIDQIAASFHHFVWPNMEKSSSAITTLLHLHGFQPRCIYEPLGWMLFY